MRMTFQVQPTSPELTDLRLSVMQQVDTNRDGKIELGEFARYISSSDNNKNNYGLCLESANLGQGV